ncbi:MAG: NrfD/PsrC family molybdoenzyme membrane anchor subunit [Rhodospirillales bacterium]
MTANSGDGSMGPGLSDVGRPGGTAYLSPTLDFSGITDDERDDDHDTSTVAGAGRSGSIHLATAAFFGLLAGLIGFYNVLAEGHVVYNTGTDMMWGLLIANYAFWALASFGLSFIATLSLGFGVRVLRPLVRRSLALAIATIIAAMISLWLELGQPFLGYAIPLNMQMSSPMFWMGAFYFTYLGLLVVTLYRTFAPGGPGTAGRALSIAHFVAALLALITQGLMYGMMSMRPFWYSPVLPLYFLLASFLIGVALMMVLVNLGHGFDHRNMPRRLQYLMARVLPLILLVTLTVYAFAYASRMITGLWSNADGLQVYHHIVASPLFYAEIAVGFVVPAILLLSPRLRIRPGLQALAGLAVIVGVYIGRYEFITAGQLVPLFKGQSKAELISYVPSPTEWLVVALSVSVALLIYVAATLAYRLSELPAGGERTGDATAPQIARTTVSASR